jgi:hypothetical protein
MRERRANVGDYVGPGSPVAVMFATDAMEMRVPLTDADLASMRFPWASPPPPPIQAPSRTSPASPAAVNAPGKAALVRTEASVDARTRLVYGVVEVRDPFNPRHAAPLAPGMFVQARLEGSSRETTRGRTAQRAEAQRVRLRRHRRKTRSTCAKCAPRKPRRTRCSSVKASRMASVSSSPC